MEMTSKIIEEICDNGLEYLYLASLITSDNILSIEDAEKALEEVEKGENAVKESNLTNEKKEEFYTFFKKARNILNGDIERFKNEK